MAGAWACIRAFGLGSDRPRIRFEDASGASGLTFVLHHSPTERKYLVETMAGGMAAFDYDNDGRLDLFFPNGAALPALVKSGPEFANRLYRNEGAGRFTDVTAAAGLAGSGYAIGAAAGDFDNDGFADLFVAGVHESHLYRNVDGRRFEDVTKAAGIQDGDWAVAAAWLDYDRDGLLDLFIVNYVQWSPESNKLCHDPSGRYPVYCHPREFGATANKLYHNLGGGRFEDVSVSSGIARFAGKGMSVAVSDYDLDGYPDIFVTNDALPNFLFRNLGNGKFAEVALEAGVALNDDGKAVSAMGADFRDYDNDGLPDLVFTALTRETFPLFRNLGKGEFRDVTNPSRLARLSSRLAGWGVAMADFDNDGWKDLFTANAHVTDNIELFSSDRYKLPNTVFANQRDGTFADVSAESGAAFARPRAHRGAVAADFDGDGKLDVVASVLGERPEFWQNATSGGAHWLELKLTGRRSNRDGIGAVVRLGNQWNQMTSSGSYACSSLAPVHFGLGAATSVPRIEIRWPSGTLQQLRDVKADQVLRVREPAK